MTSKSDIVLSSKKYIIIFTVFFMFFLILLLLYVLKSSNRLFLNAFHVFVLQIINYTLTNITLMHKVAY